MLEPVPVLSSDLEWMLQSGQATTEMLVEALVEEYYWPVYNLALVTLNDEITAKQAARETFSNALLNVFRYRSAVGIDIWLYRLAVDTIRKRLATRPKFAENQAAPGLSPESGGVWDAMAQLPEQTRFAVAIHTLQGWEPAVIAQILHAKEQAIQQCLDAGYQVIREVIDPGSNCASENQKEFLRARLAGILRERQPDLETTPVVALPEDVQSTVAYVLSRTYRTGSLMRRFASVKEVLLVIVAALVIGAFIWGVNVVSPEPQDPPAPTRGVNPAGAEIPEEVPVERNRRTPPAKPTLTPTPKYVFYSFGEGDTPKSISATNSTPEAPAPFYNP